MQEDKFGKLIKEIRKKYHLTQKDLADKYHVTYQAVSKWENNKNLPDVSLMKKISSDYNISLDDMMDGNLNNKRKNKNLLILLLIICMICLVLLIIVIKNNNSDFEMKGISSTCKDYKISGVISYNKSKSAIYIPKIEYCGEEMRDTYQNITCTLYEKNNDLIKEISTYSYQDNKALTISEFMKLVTFNVDNYLKVCNDYNNFYLEIKAVDENNKMFFHTIPLTIDNNCS